MQKGNVHLPGTACWAVTSCFRLWGWFGVSTHGSGAAQKFHLPVPRLLMFLVYPAGHGSVLMEPNSSGSKVSLSAPDLWLLPNIFSNVSSKLQ